VDGVPLLFDRRILLDAADSVFHVTAAEPGVVAMNLGGDAYTPAASRVHRDIAGA
jgi:hypothetical protein